MPTATALPALADNYIWMLAGDGGIVVVDPGDSAPVLAALPADGRLDAILLTHHHADHVGGARDLRERTGAPCIGPDDDRLPWLDRRVGDGDTVEAAGLRFEVLDIPGHTRSHVAFHGAGHLFCGDTLFGLGCGRLFEGTPAQMLASLDRLAALPGDAKVCCGHEYTLANARFAEVAEPGNAARDAYVARASAARAAGRPTLPTTLDEERRCNPFLRVDSPGVVSTLGARTGSPPAGRVEAFATLRAWKDGFRP